MQQIKRRTPQPRCRCGHARKNHDNFVITQGHMLKTPGRWHQCGFCYTDCNEFVQDNLATLERLYIYNEEKKKETAQFSM